MLSKTDIQQYLDKAISFEKYFQVFEERSIKIKSGNTEGIAYSEYYLLNFQRLKRGLKTVLSSDLLESINRLDQKITWLTISEYWCGDAAQSLGIVKNIADVSDGKVDLKIVFRDENLELMDEFLTNGGRAIPKIIQLNSTQDIISSWGPRPSEAQDLVQKKLKEKEPYAKDLHKWYATNKAVDLQKELGSFLSKQ